MSTNEITTEPRIIKIFIPTFFLILWLILGLLEFGLITGAFWGIISFFVIRDYISKKYSPRSESKDSADDTTYTPDITKDKLRQLLESEFVFPLKPVIASLQTELIIKSISVNFSDAADRELVNWFIKQFKLYQNGKTTDDMYLEILKDYQTQLKKINLDND
ncbi:MAG: hypothetical protein ACXADY_10010 [Candidatus Hodarchaeales archaeon]|jgi:hypothetical protein